jgi:HSP20 family molecular chaperone IbpA
MRSRDFHNLMWGEALSLLEQAERLQRQFFRLDSARAPAPSWEPPIDVIETADALFIEVALPGVGADAVTIGMDQGGVTISALRAFPARGGDASIRRVEIPYGRFERRIALPMHALELAGRTLRDGCLTLRFAKRKEAA